MVDFGIVKFPKSMLVDRAQFHVNEAIAESGFTVECLNAVRRSAYRLETIGLAVSPDQKASWVADLPNFHNELVEVQLESIPVHFMAIKSDGDALAASAPPGEDETIRDLQRRHKAALGVLPGKYEVLLDVTNDSFTSDMIVTTEHVRLVSLLSSEQDLQNLARLLFPAYNTRGRVDTTGTGRYLDLFALPKRALGAPPSRVVLRAGFEKVPAEGRRIVVTNFGYLPVPDPEAMNAKDEELRGKIDATLRRAAGTIADNEVDTANLKRRRVDFFISDWQQDRSLHKKGEYVIFMKTVPVFSERVALQLMTVRIMEDLMIMEANDTQTIEVEQDSATKEFFCEMRVTNPTVSAILARRFTDTFFGKAARDPMVVFCADRKNHPGDSFTLFKVIYRTREGTVFTVEKIKQQFQSDLKEVTGTVMNPRHPSLMYSMSMFGRNVVKLKDAVSVL